MDETTAHRFAAEWIDAWNAHDLGAVLEHYEDDFEMSSPIIIAMMGEPSGTLRGKEAVRRYWIRALNALPDLRFEHVATLVGANSLVIHYKGHRGAVAEFFHFGPTGKVAHAFAHYAIP